MDLSKGMFIFTYIIPIVFRFIEAFKIEPPSFMYRNALFEVSKTLNCLSIVCKCIHWKFFVYWYNVFNMVMLMQREVIIRFIDYKLYLIRRCLDSYLPRNIFNRADTSHLQPSSYQIKHLSGYKCSRESQHSYLCHILV